MESFNTTNISDVTDVVDDLKQTRKKKLKMSAKKGPTRSRGTMKVESFTEVAKSLIGRKKETNPR